jgi:hypothetical protein
MMRSHAFLDVKIPCERLTRKELRCGDDDIVLRTSPMNWAARGVADRRLAGTWERRSRRAASRFRLWCR